MTPSQILLRSSWQTVNIGDIAHTPGLLWLLEKYLPDVELTLWPNNVGDGVEPMLRKAFPKVRLVKGHLNAGGRPDTEALRTAFEEADFFLHGSGPSVVARKEMDAWRRQTGKPYGVFGVTVGEVDDFIRDLLSGAEFVFCRDSISLAFLRDQGVRPGVLEFGPDGAFGTHLRNEPRAIEYLTKHGLEEGKFLCAIPRLRYSPYHEIHNRPPTETDLERATVSARHVEEDLSKLRCAVTAWVRKTGWPALVCPEMTYEVEVAKKWVVDPLPADVREKVVWKDSYWLPDEAVSVYSHARALISCEMHSPIMATAAGTPAIYVRQPSDTSKGQMWRDIGLSPWIFEIEETRGEDLAAALLEIHRNYPEALKRTNQAMAFVQDKQERAFSVLARVLG
ncbi:polysaccharide pyruvyl transferase family protein [bacterium]|nr:polysaccharide pyruvyl transferase family protein [bacterium]